MSNFYSDLRKFPDTAMRQRCALRLLKMRDSLAPLRAKRRDGIDAGRLEHQRLRCGSAEPEPAAAGDLLLSACPGIQGSLRLAAPNHR